MTEKTTPEPGNRKRGVRLSPDEVWSVIKGSHTGILATLRRDGVPIMLPIWFAAVVDEISDGCVSG